MVEHEDHDLATWREVLQVRDLAVRAAINDPVDDRHNNMFYFIVLVVVCISGIRYVCETNVVVSCELCLSLYGMFHFIASARGLRSAGRIRWLQHANHHRVIDTTWSYNMFVNVPIVFLGLIYNLCNITCSCFIMCLSCWFRWRFQKPII